jgi:glutamate-ammonia-ligase adenylyltransferase
MESGSLTFDAVFPADLGAGREIAELLWLRFQDRLQQEKLALPGDREFIADLLRVWVASQFVADFSLRDPVALLDLYHSGDLVSAERSVAYSPCLRELSPVNEDGLMRDLRGFRNREMTRIAWRDITGSATLNQTLSDLSLLAEACLQFAHDFSYRSACSRWGTPLLGDGTPQQLTILGMGKLGGGELNFSSDVDLIFAFEEEGVLKGKRGRSYNEFFIQVARQLIRVIDTVTADGFVFRVDVRLRPFGDSGPLVMTFDAMENYYQDQAREWERYAFIKARPVAGDLEAGARLEAILKPFVYRRYLDYGSFFELRKMRSRVERECIRDGTAENVKLGAGWIREIEFIGQVFQLIRGGRDRALQERSILKVLDVIEAKSLLPGTVVATLKNGYEFLRIVENRLQEYADRQVHELPVGQHEQLRIALGLGFADWQSAREQIDGIRRQVHQIFEQVFVSPKADNADGDWALIWDGNGSLDELNQAVQRLGYQDST